jgi:hypothetical protein
MQTLEEIQKSIQEENTIPGLLKHIEEIKNKGYSNPLHKEYPHYNYCLKKLQLLKMK